MPINKIQEDLDAKIASFWDTPCGTNALRAMGLSDSSPQSLSKFDDWYFSFYPYLLKHVPVPEMRNKKVLEIGLGMGSLGQRIAENGASYVGMDIAETPVRLLRARLERNNLPGEVIRGNILDSGLPDETFDHVVSIGCFHHTGNIPLAISETWRILKPGGQAHIMLYNLFSYRQWLTFPSGTFAALFRQLTGGAGGGTAANAKNRKMYDYNPDGQACPETALTSKSELRMLARGFSSCRIKAENIHEHDNAIFGFLGRKMSCRIFGALCGLDLYCTLVK